MAEIENDNIRTPPHYREGAPPQVVTADTARQGPAGGRVLMVLAGAMALCVLAFVALMWGYERPNPTSPPPPAPASHGPEKALTPGAGVKNP